MGSIPRTRLYLVRINATKHTRVPHVRDCLALSVAYRNLLLLFQWRNTVLSVSIRNYPQERATAPFLAFTMEQTTTYFSYHECCKKMNPPINNTTPFPRRNIRTSVSPNKTADVLPYVSAVHNACAIACWVLIGQGFGFRIDSEFNNSANSTLFPVLYI